MKSNIFVPLIAESSPTPNVVRRAYNQKKYLLLLLFIQIDQHTPMP
jgi:hypothetical protein